MQSDETWRLQQREDLKESCKLLQQQSPGRGKVLGAKAFYVIRKWMHKVVFSRDLSKIS